MGLLNKYTILMALTACLVLTVCLEEASAEKEIPKTRFGQNGAGPTLTFQFCHSCGYRKAFEEYATIVSEKYPQILLHGANYEPASLSFYVSKLTMIVKFALIMAILSAYDVWGFIGQPTPRWYTWCQENKMYAGMMIFFVGNMLEGQLISSGAFEISLNDVPIWSKLDTGRIPAPQELFNIIDSHLHLSGNVPDFESH